MKIGIFLSPIFANKSSDSNEKVPLSSVEGFEPPWVSSSSIGSRSPSLGLSSIEYSLLIHFLHF